MDLVIDANVLFSALIKDSFAYNLIFSDAFHIFTPEYIFLLQNTFSQNWKNTKMKFLTKQNEQQKNSLGLLKH